MLLNNQYAKEEIRREYNTPRLMRCNKSSPKREVYNNKCQHQKKEGSHIDNLTLYLKELEKEKQMKPKVCRRKEIRKIRVEINEIETKRTIEKIN